MKKPTESDPFGKLLILIIVITVLTYLIEIGAFNPAIHKVLTGK